ncbi:hypothetical protein JCM12296A_52270 [Desulfosarcina cetonica]|uniref:hypothetical protein n=1 Tax=Desulfosarcina cetonica TaxID=90730 RepID=UPI0006CFAC00|nr:hypothetical protein [Desulfosarcina cetonica]
MQLSIFPEEIDTANLVAQREGRDVFYRIWIEAHGRDGFLVFKESGVNGSVRDRRTWSFTDRANAEKFMNSKVKAKTNPDRKSPRKYTRCRTAGQNPGGNLPH